MKEKYLPCKYLLVIIILFTCLFIFFTSSFALIPGDFNGDGQVGFPDLIILALAYNTTPSDPKWNPVCDLNSDDAIGFPDLIILAMHYGETTILSGTVISDIGGPPVEGSLVEVKEGVNLISNTTTDAPRKI